MRPAEKVLREPCAWPGSVSFQLAELKVGEGKVPVSIVLYIDSKYLKKGILVRPVYRKCIFTIPYIMCDVISVPDITSGCRLIGQSVQLGCVTTVMSVFPTVAAGIQVEYCRVLHMLPLLLWENMQIHYTNPAANCQRFNRSFQRRRFDLGAHHPRLAGCTILVIGCPYIGPLSVSISDTCRS
jgi:hypothetical protein